MRDCPWANCGSWRARKPRPRKRASTFPSTARTASQRFDRQKILQGLLKSCEKRPVATAKLESLVDEVERFVHEAPERERKTSEIGELLMNRLKKLDKVAYVRFASVYLDFKDVKEFMSELKGLLKERSKK